MSDRAYVGMTLEGIIEIKPETEEEAKFISECKQTLGQIGKQLLERGEPIDEKLLTKIYNLEKSDMAWQLYRKHLRNERQKEAEEAKKRYEETMQNYNNRVAQKKAVQNEESKPQPKPIQTPSPSQNQEEPWVKPVRILCLALSLIFVILGCWAIDDVDEALGGYLLFIAISLLVYPSIGLFKKIKSFKSFKSSTFYKEMCYKKINRIHSYYKSGAITEKEFNRLKQEIMNKIKK